LSELSDVKLGVGIQVEASDYRDDILVTGGDAHLVQVPLQVLVINVLVVPVIDLTEEALDVEIVAGT
jgi:hypothetical protein